ncbi:MAG: CHRD domain-containing protein [Vicinamibacterales bacterium]
MTRSALAIPVLALTLAVAACDDKTPTSPSVNPPKFTATLLSTNEVPPVSAASPESNGTGTVTITFNLTKDAAGTVTAATADFSGTFSGFPNGTALTAAHIHPGAAGANGSPLVSLGLGGGEITFPTGTGSLTKNAISMSVDQANTILANPNGFYFNIHTAANPGGVARGQLVRTQ